MTEEIRGKRNNPFDLVFLPLSVTLLCSDNELIICRV